MTTKVCANCAGTEGSLNVKFSRNNKTCNVCRASLHSEYHTDRLRKYRAAKPHLTFHMTSRYLAKKAGVFSDLSHEDALSIYKNPNVCVYCDKGIDVSVKRALHIDHIIPMSQGGPNSRWNLVKACVSCNSSKDDKSLTDFYARTDAFTAERYASIIEEMARLSNRSIAEINALITQSHAFELAFERERQRMIGAIDNFNAHLAVS